jgi:Glycosyl hydrolases family 16
MKANSSALSFVPFSLSLLALTGIQAEAQAVPGPPPWGGDYKLVWSQDFTTMTSDDQIGVVAGRSLGKSDIWISHYSNGMDDADFVDPHGHDQPFGIDGGGKGSNYLTIRAQKDPTHANGANGVFTCGTLSSQDTNGNGFAQQYGYFEASMWVPNVPSATNHDAPNTHPAFWVLAHNSGASGGAAEIDATESYGNWGTGPKQNPPGDPNNSSMTWHDWFKDGSKNQSKNSFVNRPNMTTGFHQYGVDVEPTGITWYYDRQKVWSAPVYPDAQVPLGVLVTLALGGGNFNNPANNNYDFSLTADPSDMKVQYVAVWASPNSPNNKTPSAGETGDIVDADFSTGTFQTMGWEADGNWSITDLKSTKADLANDPGAVAECAANSSTVGTLTKKFDAITNPPELTLTFDAGYAWGGKDHSQPLQVMLLDSDGNGYVFDVHRASATWAAQWGKVTKYVCSDPMTWASSSMDTTQPAVLDGGGLRTLTITRDAQGHWTFNGQGWTGGPLAFTDTTTNSFSQVVLRGPPNSDVLLFNKIKLVANQTK